MNSLCPFPEPWQEAESYYARLEREFVKYGNGFNCRVCGKPLWDSYDFCPECFDEAVELLEAAALWISEKEKCSFEKALDTAFSEITNGKEWNNSELYDKAADWIVYKKT